MSEKYDLQAARTKLARLAHGPRPAPLWEQTVRAAKQHGRLVGTVLSITERRSSGGVPYALLRVVDKGGATARVLLCGRALVGCRPLPTPLLKRFFRVKWRGECGGLFVCCEAPPSKAVVRGATVVKPARRTQPPAPL